MMHGPAQLLFRLGQLPTLPAAWQCDLEGDRLTWSRGVFDLFGLPHNRPPLRAETAAMYLPKSRALLEELRAEAIARAGSFTFEAQIRRQDGALRWIRVCADTVSRGGRTVQLYGTKQDITAEMEHMLP